MQFNIGICGYFMKGYLRKNHHKTFFKLSFCAFEVQKLLGIVAIERGSVIALLSLIIDVVLLEWCSF